MIIGMLKGSSDVLHTPIFSLLAHEFHESWKGHRDLGFLVFQIFQDGLDYDWIQGRLIFYYHF